MTMMAGVRLRKGALCDNTTLIIYHGPFGSVYCDDALSLSAILRDATLRLCYLDVGTPHRVSSHRQYGGSSETLGENLHLGDSSVQMLLRRNTPTRELTKASENNSMALLFFKSMRYAFRLIIYRRVDIYVC